MTEELTPAQRDAVVALKLRYAYERGESDSPMMVSDLVDGEIVERPAEPHETVASIWRELGDFGVEPESDTVEQRAGESPDTQAA